jgi:hypothetical protein
MPIYQMSPNKEGAKLKDKFIYLNNETDLLQKGDEFQEPPHYRTKGAGVKWHAILDSRIGGKPCKECRYRSPRLIKD